MEDTLCWAEVDLGALVANLAHLRRRIGHESLILVAKADGYGHGACTVATAAQGCGVDRVAVATFHEAWELRRSGVHARILVLGPFLEEEAEFGLPHGVEFTLVSKEHARILERAARRSSIPARCHLKVDTGLNRLGMRPDEALELLSELEGSRFVHWRGCMTHIAASEGGNAPSALRQVALFDDFVARARRRNYLVGVELHVANSSGVLSGLSPRYDACRVGIAAFGVSPHPSLETAELRPVLSVRTRVVQLKEIAEGGRVGYDGTWTAMRKTRLAVLPWGYADGMVWRDTHSGSVLIRGQRAPLVGRISMDLATVDVTDIAGVGLGERVTLLGADGADRIRAEEIARTHGTIPHAILCSLGKRVRRITIPAEVEGVPQARLERQALSG